MAEYGESYLAFSSACVHKYIYNVQQEYSSFTIYIQIHIARNFFAFLNCPVKNINFYVPVECVCVCAFLLGSYPSMFMVLSGMDEAPMEFCQLCWRKLPAHPINIYPCE